MKKNKWLVTALALMPVFCGSANAAPVAGEVAPNSLAGQTIVFASSGGILQDGQKQAIWDPFQKESGATVLQDSGVFSKLKAMVDGNNVTWDLFVGDRYLSYQHCGELFEKVDRSVVDLSQIPEGLVSDECMIPAIIYADIMVYDADKYPEAPQSWKDFFDVEKFPGKRGVNMSSDPMTALIVGALLADGVAPDKLYPIDFDRAFNKLRSIEDHLVGWTTGAQAQQQLESGEVSIALVWNGRGFGAAKAGHNIKPIWNDWMVAVDSVSIPKGSKNVAAAQAGLNYYLGAKQTERLAELTSYAPVNVNAKPQLSDLAKQWIPDTERFKTSHNPDVKWWSEHWQEFADRWSAWISGN